MWPGPLWIPYREAHMRVPSIVILLLCTTAVAQATDKAKLLSDLVAIQDGKMKLQDVRLCTPKGASSGKNMQVLIRSEAPAAGLIHRDRFVFMHSALTALLVSNQAWDCKHSEQLIGTADLSVDLIMEPAGVQIAVAHSGKVERTTKRWEDL